MIILAAAAPSVKPEVVPFVPQPMHHVIDSVGWDPIIIALVIGLFMGTALTYWWSKVGFAGMFSEVKADIGDLKVDFAKLKATTPTPVIVTSVTPTTGGPLVSSPTV